MGYDRAAKSAPMRHISNLTFTMRSDCRARIHKMRGKWTVFGMKGSRLSVRLSRHA
jgi:hypothetical protein